jgi:hypothetical protein
MPWTKICRLLFSAVADCTTRMNLSVTKVLPQTVMESKVIVHIQPMILTEECLPLGCYAMWLL